MELGALGNVALGVLGVALVWMTGAWTVSVALKRTDIADVAWGLGFSAIAWWVALVAAPQPAALRVWMAAVFVTVWGVRLAVHIASRGFGPGRGEDPRYAQMRERVGASWPRRSLATVFWLQGGLMLVVGMPLVVLGASKAPGFWPSDVLAIALWLLGVAVEATADWQLGAWLSAPENRGRPLTTGVWAWTRHPNYLGDALAWWGIGLLAVRMPGGWLALLGPLAMTLLLRYVSGVPLLEARHIGEPEWDAYRRITPTFWPAPPQKR